MENVSWRTNIERKVLQCPSYQFTTIRFLIQQIFNYPITKLLNFNLKTCLINVKLVMIPNIQIRYDSLFSTLESNTNRSECIFIIFS